MKFKNLIIVAFILILLSSCEDNSTKNESLLKSFGYTAQSQGNQPILTGKVSYQSSNNEKPLDSVIITVDTFHAITDKEGFFKVQVFKGSHRVCFSKRGFSTLYLEEYTADSAQISDARVVLKPGANRTTINVSKKIYTER